MESIESIIQSAEDDIYRELLDVAASCSPLEQTAPKHYRRQAVEAMTALAANLRQRPAIRQFFLTTDQNPDEVIDGILRRAIAAV